MRLLRGDQPKAFESIRDFLQGDDKMHLLSGAAGTGKTFTLGEVVQYVKVKRLRSLITAPTHKAVKVLKALINSDENYSTIHSALGMKEVISDHGAISFKVDPKMDYPAEKYDLIIIDEASMLDDAIFEELVNLSERNKKILFVGDPYQIPPVNHIHAKPFLKSIQAQYKIRVSTLNEIIRQAEGSPIIAYASSIRMDIHKPVQIFNSQEVQNDLGAVFTLPMTERITFLNSVLPLFKSVEYKNDIDHIKVIGWRNITVDTYNKLIREYIFGENIPKIIVGDKLIADAPVVEGRQVLISTNEEMEVQDVKIAEEELSEEFILKYYKIKVRVLGRSDKYVQYMLRIIHEDSEKIFDKICRLQVHLAKSFPIGSYKARSSWMDYYEFLNHWHKMKYSYCITAHKSQGSTYNTAYILAWDILMNNDTTERNRILYTACTRPSRTLYVEYET